MNYYIRCTQKTHKEMKMAALNADVTLQDFAAQVWEAYKSAGNPRSEISTDSPTEGVPNQSQSNVEFLTVDPKGLLPQESRHVERLIRILRSPRPGLPDAIISNLNQFDFAREMHERYVDSDAAGAAAPDKAERTGKPGGAYAALERSQKSIDEQLKRAGELGSGSAGGKASHGAKARKRRGA
jgi:hypothetical protein